MGSVHVFLILAALRVNAATAPAKSERPTSNLPPRPNRSAVEPPGYDGLCRLPLPTDVMSNLRLTEHSHGARAQTELLRRLDITSCWAVIQQVSRGLHGSALRSGLHRLRFEHRRHSVRASPSFSNPRARVVTRLKRSSPIRKSADV